MAEIYGATNGGYYFGRALLLRPLRPLTDPRPLSIHAWNELNRWKSAFGKRALDLDQVTFFAEDALGVQFGVSGGTFVRVDPELGSVEPFADSAPEWTRTILDDPDLHCGRSMLDAWEKKNGLLAAGERLIPRVLFMLGGEYSVDNLVVRDEITGMRIRGELSDHLLDVKDGDVVSFGVREPAD